MLKQDAAQYEGYDTPGIRLSESAFPGVHAVGFSELDWLRAIHAFDQAHVVMLGEGGLIRQTVAARLAQGLLELGDDRCAAQRRLEVGGGVHSGEKILIRRFGEDVGGWIHLGRSTGDLSEVATRISLRLRLLKLMSVVLDSCESICDFAEKHEEILFVSHTGGQVAQATTVAHWALMFESVFSRDFRRLRHVYDATNRSPAGAAIVTGSDFPLDRGITAQLLGFDAVLVNTFDAIHSHDVESLESISVAATVASNLARFASDVDDLLRFESCHGRLPDRYFGTSSVMAQKRNPKWPGVVRGDRSSIVASVVEVLLCDASSTGFAMYERSNATECVMKAYDCLIDRFAELVPLLDCLTVTSSRAESILRESWAQAADLASLIVRRRGTSWRTAHQIVAIAVRQAGESGTLCSEFRSHMLDDAAIAYNGRSLGLADDEVREALDPLVSVTRRSFVGGPGASSSDEQIQHARVELATARQDLNTLRARLSAAECERLRRLESCAART